MTMAIFGTPLALRVVRVSSELRTASVFRLLVCLSPRLGATRSLDLVGNKARLPFTQKTRKLWLQNKLLHTIPFETFQKL